MVRNTWEFLTANKIVFGNGSIGNLDEVLQQLNAKNILIVTDQGVKGAGILDIVKGQLVDSDYNVITYDEVVPEPPIDTAMDCYSFAKDKMETEVVIGLGGGSSIDMAKIVALLLKHDGHPLDYFGGENQVPGPILPLISIPTTAGTGSEVTSVAVLTDTENDLKVGISDNHLRSTVTILDPELTIGLPAYVTACSGIDALSHAIEAYTAKSFKYIQSDEKLLFQGSLPISDGLALQAIELIVNNLPLAVHQGSNLEARSNMMLGSLLAGMAFSNAGTAMAHALAYPIGGLCKSPHGEVTGLLLPYVMDYNASTLVDKMPKLANAFGLDVYGLSKDKVAEVTVKFVYDLLAEVGLPQKLSQIGIEESQLESIAEKSLGIERLVRNNPRVPTKETLEVLLKKAL